MTLVDSWTSASTTAAVTGTTTVPRAVTAGRFVAVAITTNGTAIQSSLTDPRGNTWVKDYTQTFGSTFTTSLWRCKLTTGLQAGDSLTVTTSASANRRAFVGAVFDDVTPGSLDAVALGVNGQTSGTASAGPTPATTGDSLVLFLSGSTSNGLLSAATSPLIFIGAIATTAGSAERSAGLAYKYATGAAAQSGSGTLAASATWLAGLAAYRTGTTTPPDPPTSGPSRLYDGSTELTGGSWSLWDGSTEVALTPSLWDGTSELTLS